MKALSGGGPGRSHEASPLCLLLLLRVCAAAAAAAAAALAGHVPRTCTACHGAPPGAQPSGAPDFLTEVGHALSKFTRQLRVEPTGTSLEESSWEADAV